MFGRHVNNAQDPMRSYFKEYEKSEIHLLYFIIYTFNFTSILFIVCEVLMWIL